VLGGATIAQTSLTYQYERGFLSDPYKLAFVAGVPETDERPDERHQLAWLTRFRHHFRSADASLHFDYQLYADDWEMVSHTFELAWYQTLFDRLLIAPSFRYYSQSKAEFYAPYYAAQRSDGFRSSDYRLSAFGAWALGVKLEWPFEIGNLAWAINGAYSRYESDPDIALGSVNVENPGLVSYDMYTIGLRLRF
jgi:hypothetical protein